MSKQVRHFYEFGSFRVDVAERRLLRDDRPIPLPPKAFDTLLALVQNSGHLLTKDELLQTVWPDTFVEENNLKQYVSALRKALDDGAGNGYIETVPRVGYRFAPGVREVWDEDEGLIVENRAQYRIVVREEEQEEEFETEPVDAVARSKDTGTRGHGDTETRELANSFIGASQLRRISLSRTIVAAVLIISVTVGAILLARSLLRKDVKERKSLAFKSVAVLPFKTISPTAGEEYLGLGMADTLIAKLSRVNQINVRPISAVHRFTGLSQDPLAAGRALGVEAVIDGRIQRVENHVRVTVELLNVRDGAVLWTETLDENSVDIFALQDRITARVIDSLPTALTGEERALVAKRYTTSPLAYELYLQGRFLWNKRTAENLKKAIEYFEQAVALDANYALAHAGLADCYALLSEYSDIPSSETVPKAKAAAHTALKIDETLAEAHTSLAYVLGNYDWNAPEAEKEFKRAIELNPSYATAHQWYHELLGALGRTDEADAEIQRARELDPLSPTIRGVAALSPKRSYDEALSELRKILEMEPNFWLAEIYIGHVYERHGHYDKALAQFQRVIDITGNRQFISEMGRVYARSGQSARAREVLAELRSPSRKHAISAFTFAQIYALLGDEDQAIRELEKCYAARLRYVYFIKNDPTFANLRSEPRFQNLLRRMNLAA